MLIFVSRLKIHATTSSFVTFFGTPKLGHLFSVWTIIIFGPFLEDAYCFALEVTAGSVNLDDMMDLCGGYRSGIEELICPVRNSDIETFFYNALSR